MKSDVTKLENIGELKQEEGKIDIVMVGTRTCGSCQMLGYVLNQLEDKTGIKSYKLDGPDNPDITEKFRIMKVPHIIVYKDGKAVHDSNGFKALVQLEKEIEPYI